MKHLNAVCLATLFPLVSLLACPKNPVEPTNVGGVAKTAQTQSASTRPFPGLAQLWLKSEDDVIRLLGQPKQRIPEYVQNAGQQVFRNLPEIKTTGMQYWDLGDFRLLQLTFNDGKLRAVTAVVRDKPTQDSLASFVGSTQGYSLHSFVANDPAKLLKDGQMPVFGFYVFDNVAQLDLDPKAFPFRTPSQKKTEVDHVAAMSGNGFPANYQALKGRYAIQVYDW